MATNNSVNVGLSGATGSGSFVGSTNASLTTPALGTPSSGTLSSCIGYPATALSGTTTLANGGTNANLTASNGGIVYSGASAFAVLSGTATAGQLLLSGSSTTPAWSTTTYPTTNAVNTLLYASSANVMDALTTANNGILVTSAGGIPSIGNTVGAGLTMPSITFNTTTGVVGTTTNDSAAAGSVGQLISSLIPEASAVSVTNNTRRDITSITLTAGDWDVWGNVAFDSGTATNLVLLYGWMNTASATFPDTSFFSTQQFGSSGLVTTAATFGFVIPSQRITVANSTTTTIYLSVFATFSVSTLVGYGNIYARRRR